MSYPLRLPANEPLITLTNPKPSLWVIELHNGQDARLTLDLVDNGLKPALDAVERHWRTDWRAAQKAKDKEGGKGALIIVGRRDQDKFFSNGLDYQNVVTNLNFFPITFDPLLTRLLTFPIPVIAAINGHCFAGGFMLALACDYRVMTDGSKRNSWLCMNEVHFGAQLPASFTAIFRGKTKDPLLRRKITLEGHRFSPTEGLAAGLVDHLVNGNTEDILAKAEQLADSVAPLARTGVWGLIKTDLYRDTLDYIAKESRITNAQLADAAARSRL
ncbi:hypothetical protein HGRIS_003588 [Hohenbuehelia grisea]|uniref:ClpP/crotonase n=1 Tax=Hohenbuehelia grisea TaxID=104357 RepID=A0ABR3JFX7_9AGAR